MAAGSSCEKRLKDPLVMTIPDGKRDVRREVPNNGGERFPRRLKVKKWGQARVLYAICGAAVFLSARVGAQALPPFDVSNPKHLNWSMEEAERIYISACELVARSVRPEKPPQLQPKFLLVLGAKADQMVRTGTSSEIHLRKWDPARFAEAMVLLTLREAVKNEDVAQLARDTLNAAEATVSVNQLRQRR
jgi:hypothetical protein